MLSLFISISSCYCQRSLIFLPSKFNKFKESKWYFFGNHVVVVVVDLAVVVILVVKVPLTTSAEVTG